MKNRRKWGYDSIETITVQSIVCSLNVFSIRLEKWPRSEGKVIHNWITANRLPMTMIKLTTSKPNQIVRTLRNRWTFNGFAKYSSQQRKSINARCARSWTQDRAKRTTTSMIERSGCAWNAGRIFADGWSANMLWITTRLRDPIRMQLPLTQPRKLPTEEQFKLFFGVITEHNSTIVYNLYETRCFH